MSDCIGMTRAEAEARCIAAAPDFGGNVEDATNALDALLSLGWLKYCSVHPDRIIMSRVGWQTGKLAQALRSSGDSVS